MSLPSDITKNILSDYIEYDQLLELINYIPNLYLNPKRIQIEKTFHKNVRLQSKLTFIDEDLRKSEHFFDNGNKQDEYNYKGNYLHGKMYQFYLNGNSKLEYNYVNDLKNGRCYCWYESGILWQDWNFKEGKLDGKHYQWDKNGNLEFEWFDNTEMHYQNGDKICKEVYIDDEHIFSMS